MIKDQLEQTGMLEKVHINGVGTTGSARYLIKAVMGADVAKTEIIAHAVASTTLIPDVNTILEIGGQDSKIIILRNGIVADFAMNLGVCSGYGEFSGSTKLPDQASRLKISVTMQSDRENAVNIACRCGVFAESDMIHKTQMGYSKEDIIHGLCDALVRNYLNNVGKGKDIKPPIVFQGGVAYNKGIISF